MGCALILESAALMHWCERQGLGPCGLTGISMGGHMASLAACNWPKPIPIVPCMSWSTASQTFTRGVLSGAIPWKVMEEQYFTDRVYEREIAELIESPEERHHFVGDPSNAVAEYQGYPNVMNAKSTPNCDNNPDHHMASIPGSNIEMSQQRGKQNVLMSSLGGQQLYRSTSYIINALGGETPQAPPPLPKTRPEVIKFMTGLMDHCTHLGNFPKPLDLDLAVVILAKYDAYIIRDGVQSLADIWPGSEVRFLDNGHVASFIKHRDQFRKAIRDAFQRQIAKYSAT